MHHLIIFVILLFASSLVFSATESPVEIIPLAPPLDQDDAEISGLTWCGDKLILMPQYPRRLSESSKSYFYYLTKKQILDYLDGETNTPLVATEIEISEKGLRKAVTVFDGYEAIACNNEKLWLSIEAINLIGTYQSFVVPGSINFEGAASIAIDEKQLVKLETQSGMRNMGDEAILLSSDSLIALHEINDSRVVANPKARIVKTTGPKLSSISFPNIPYRITDATDVDKHKKYSNVERLIEFQISHDGIKLVNQPPIQIQMDDVEGRNWEGLARLDNRGFLLASDKHPSTIFAFIPFTQDQ